VKVLITGASGFLGGRLLDYAIAAWGRESVLAFGTVNNPKCETIIYDLQCEGLALEDAQLASLSDVELLIHAGAFTPKSGAQANDSVRCNQNIFFTQQLLALPFPALKKVIYTSTLDVYAAAAVISESSLTLPETLYGWSKLYCEKLVTIYARERQLSRQILRVGHVYGPGEEKYAKFLPKAIQAIVSGAPVELYGDGAELRSFIYIDDVVKAIFAAVDLTEDVDVINVVGANPIAIKDLLACLVSISGIDVQVQTRDFNGVKRDLVFDASLMNEKLLPAETDLLLGLRKEYEYFASMK